LCDVWIPFVNINYIAIDVHCTYGTAAARSPACMQDALTSDYQPLQRHRLPTAVGRAVAYVTAFDETFVRDRTQKLMKSAAN